MQNEKAVDEYQIARKHFRQLIATNGDADSRYQLPTDEVYALYLRLLRRIEEASDSSDFRGEINRTAVQWLSLRPNSEDAQRWASESAVSV